MLSKKPLLKYFWLLFTLFSVLVFSLKHYANVLLGLQYPIDFAIYHKAIIEIGSFNAINPYLSLRDIQIFADHFDPILILPAILSGFFSYSPLYSLLIEAIFVMGLFILLFKDFRNESLLDFSLIFTLVFFNRSFFSGLDWPIHPTMWSLPILYLIFKNIESPKLISGTIANLFKEVYCLFLIPMSLTGYILKKDKKWLYQALIQILFIILIFGLRPLFLKTYNYSPNILEGLKTFNYFDYLKMALPGLLLLFLTRSQITKSSVLLFLAFYIPSFGIHLISGKSYYHYGVFLAYPLLFFVIGNFKNWRSTLSPKMKTFIIIISILISFNGLKKSYRSFTSNYRNLETYQNHKVQLQKLKEKYLSTIPKGSKVLASPGLMTFALTPGVYFYQFGEYSKIEKSVDYLLLDFRSYGQNFGISKDQLSKVLNECSRFEHKVIFKESDLILLKGNFPQQCWFVNKSFWRNYKGENK